ncbi:hypothetical protein KUTeg_007658 [Tegillarca granosa]|uniref:Uncharacterized protein n=1 Tax=Tegillarca granosa TaxID=220873 RepID=A0ABQ9FID9_TEGGR|nr:hypothetical protein KUTeg_007658 [Tegillarca granosa]
MLALIGYLVKEWRYIELTISLPVIAFSFFLPESIRWLLSKGRNEEAEKIMKKLMTTNKREITEEITNTLLNKEIKPHENKKNKTQERKYTALDLVRPLQMAILSLNVWFNWLVLYFTLCQEKKV